MKTYNKKEFKKELTKLINYHSIENGSNTPDFLLADYLMDCLETFNKMSRHRDEWYGESSRRGINIPVCLDADMANDLVNSSSELAELQNKTEVAMGMDRIYKQEEKQIALEFGSECRGKVELIYYWSCIPGQFADIKNGKIYESPNGGPHFLGSKNEWYETLVETIHSMKLQLKEKYEKSENLVDSNLGIVTTVFVSSEIFSMLEQTSYFRFLKGDNSGELSTLGVRIYKEPLSHDKRDIYCQYNKYVGKIHVIGL